MATYFVAPDGDGDPCIWAKGERFDMPVIRQCETGPDYWPDVVARMTGTSITNDDATVLVIAKALVTSETGYYSAAVYKFDFDRARAILAALTGVPHD